MSADRARIMVVTGTRAEFGLLDPVMRAIQAHPDLELQVLVTGTHLLRPSETWREVEEKFPIAATVEMQREGEQSGRLADAAALGRGITGIAGAIAEMKPGWVVVLGDRIEAMAGACAASVGGVPLAHIHGGDRAEGVADEAMRHAISKLAHLHLPATATSAQRLKRMGEDPARIVAVGSPAIDGLAAVNPMPDKEFNALGSPELLFLMHPIGDAPEIELERATSALAALADHRVLALDPNHDPGREGIIEAIEASGARRVSHLPRDQFLALCKRVAPTGAIVGNSSAGLIEASALGLPAVNIGPRQSGREQAGNAVDCDATKPSVADALHRALRLDRSAIAHPYGPGDAGERIARALASVDRSDTSLLRKRCAY